MDCCSMALRKSLWIDWSSIWFLGYIAGCTERRWGWICSFQVLGSLPSGSEVSPGGNRNSRVTDGVILHIYAQCMHVSCSLCKVQPSPGASPGIPRTAGLDGGDDDTLSIIAYKPYPSQRYIQRFTAVAVSALPAPFLLMHNHWAFVWKSLRQNKLDGLLLLLLRTCYTGQGRRRPQCMDGKYIYIHSTKWKVCLYCLQHFSCHYHGAWDVKES